MRFSRLLQRAGAKGAASVALFVSLIGAAYANTAAQVNVYGVDTVRNADGAFEARYHFQRRFASNDPIYPSKVDYVSKTIKVQKRGNPMKWVKRTGLEVAVIGAVAAAGYAIDELTNQVVRPVVNDPDGYEVGFAWQVSDSAVSFQYQSSVTPETLFSELPETFVLNGYTYSKNSLYHSGNTAYANYSSPGGGRNVIFAKFSCNDACPVPVPIYTNEPVSDGDVWDIVNPIADEHPEYLSGWAVDPAGNPYIYPEIPPVQEGIANGTPGVSPDAVPVTGAQPLPPAVVVNDPLEGQGLAPDGTPTGDPVPTPEVVVETAPFQFPNDYAREDTVQAIRDWLTEEINTEPELFGENAAEDVYKPLSDMVDEGLPDLPDLLTPGDFGIHSSSSCETITFNWKGASTVFPSSAQCQKLGDAKEMLGWLIYVLTFFGCVYTVLNARSLQ